MSDLSIGHKIKIKKKTTERKVGLDFEYNSENIKSNTMCLDAIYSFCFHACIDDHDL